MAEKPDTHQDPQSGRADAPRWKPIFAPYWRIDCGPLFWLELHPKPETAIIDNAYQEAEKVIRKATAAEDLYTALEGLVNAPDADWSHWVDEWQAARAALAKANPQRTTQEPEQQPKPGEDPQDPLMKLFRLARHWLQNGAITGEAWEQFLEIWTELYEAMK